MLATVTALESFYFLSALFLASRPPDFFLWFASIQTYGLEPMILSIPFAFFYGGIAGVCVLKLNKPIA